MGPIGAALKGKPKDGLMGGPAGGLIGQPLGGLIGGPMGRPKSLRVGPKMKHAAQPGPSKTGLCWAWSTWAWAGLGSLGLGPGFARLGLGRA